VLVGGYEEGKAIAVTDDDGEGKSEELENPGLPEPQVLVSLGAINLAWSHIDALVSAALFSLLNVEGLELTILLGRADTQPKLDKMAQILRHRRDKERLHYVQKLKTQLDELRRDRNALTHGTYEGHTKAGEHIFFTPVDIIFDEDQGSAYTMRDFTLAQMTDHLQQLSQIIAEMPKHFDAHKMGRLHFGSWRTPPIRGPKEKKT
jgi:hypothetical protein